VVRAYSATCLLWPRAPLMARHRGAPDAIGGGLTPCACQGAQRDVRQGALDGGDEGADENTRSPLRRGCQDARGQEHQWVRERALREDGVRTWVRTLAIGGACKDAHPGQRRGLRTNQRCRADDAPCSHDTLALWEVSAMGLGCMGLSTNHGAPVDDQAGIALIRQLEY
jgi:hypothetical protein